MNTMNYRYVVIIHAHEAEVEVKTNDVCQAIHQFLHATDNGHDACICDGITGEVLCHNGDESYCTAEMGLMVIGYLAEQTWGEPKDAEGEICDACGGDVADGVCQFCGRCVECEDEEPSPEDVVAVPGVGLMSVFLAEVLGLPS